MKFPPLKFYARLESANLTISGDGQSLYLTILAQIQNFLIVVLVIAEDTVRGPYKRDAMYKVSTVYSIRVCRSSRYGHRRMRTNTTSADTAAVATAFYGSSVRVTSAQRHHRRNLPGRPRASQPAHHKGEGSLAGQAACEMPPPPLLQARPTTPGTGSGQASIIKQSHTQRENESSLSAN